MGDAKRRLPMLKTPGDDERTEPRPPWHWVGFGVVIIFAAWLPLAYAAEAMRARVMTRWLGDVTDPVHVAVRVATLSSRERLEIDAIAIVLAVVPLALGALAGGYVSGRWGEGSAVRIAAYAGLATSLIAAVLAWIDAGFTFAPLAAIAVAVPFAALGGHLGAKKRAGPAA